MLTGDTRLALEALYALQLCMDNEKSSLERGLMVELMRALGRKGTGKSKVRGDAKHYRAVAKARWDKAKENDCTTVVHSVKEG